MSPTRCTQWLWKQTAGFRLQISTRALAGMTRVAITILFIYVSKRLVDIATGNSAGQLTLWAILLGACIIGQLILSAIISRMNVSMSTNMSNRLRFTLFSHLMQSQWLGRENIHTADMLERLKKDVDTVADLICSSLPSAIVTITQLIAACLFLAVLDWHLTIVLIMIMPLALLVGKAYIHRMHSLTRKIRAADSTIHTHMQEHLRHRTLDATLERTTDTITQLDEFQSTLREHILSRNNYSMFSRTMVQAGFACGYATAFLWGVYGLHTGAVTFGIMTAFLQLVAQIQRPAVDLSRQLPDFIYAMASAERLDQLAQLPIEEQGSPIRLSAPTGLRLEHIDYTYPNGNRKIFHDFSHDFRPGSLTAVIGSTGAGKSTLMRLILALLLPERGSVTLYDATHTADASPRTRCNIVYVPQGNTLLSGTIRQNLLMGNPQATDEQLRQALHTAVADFVYELPLHLDTPCGESGSGLSEGQAQRIAIARGLLRPGSVVLLDEPSSALDADTERILFQRLSKTLGSRTLIIVTHRPQTATLCQATLTISDRRHT